MRRWLSSCVASMKRSAQFSEHDVSLLESLLPGLGTHLSKHTSEIFSTSSWNCCFAFSFCAAPTPQPHTPFSAHVTLTLELNPTPGFLRAAQQICESDNWTLACTTLSTAHRPAWVVRSAMDGRGLIIGPPSVVPCSSVPLKRQVYRLWIVGHARTIRQATTTATPDSCSPTHVAGEGERQRRWMGVRERRRPT